MGEALQGRRDEVVLATKFGHSGRDMGYPTTASKGSRSLRPRGRSRHRCAGCRPTGSTSTSCTCPTRDPDR